MKPLLVLLSLIFFLGSCTGDDPMANGNPSPAPDNSESNLSTNVPAPPPPIFGYDIVKTYKHDEKAFTQGLVYRNGFLYESTGQYGESSLRKVDIATGKVLQKHDIPEDYFAEGIALVGDEIFQLTWRSGVGFVYGLDDFKLEREIRYAGEGWGLTYDGTNLYQSDGTNVIRVIDPSTFQTKKTISVYDEKGDPLKKLNELEWVKGEIWANIWHSEEIGKPNHIAKIDPSTGKLTGWINLAEISPKDTIRDSENTLNGIAYDAEGDRIFVTGKNWKNLYEIKLK
ncbi:MAG: glutaminyl-peptide cyclotransferase [Pyrinomonadaceae bacterium]